MRRTLLLIALLLIVGCTPAARQVDDAPTPSAPPSSAVVQGVQDTLDTLAEAINTGQPDLLDRVFDRDNPQLNQLRYARARTIATTTHAGQPVSYTILDITDHTSYVVARIQRDDGYLVDRVFQEQDGHWRIAEIPVADLGALEPTQHGAITVYAYPHFADTTQVMLDHLDQIQTVVRTHLGREATTGEIHLYLKPCLDSPPYMGLPGMLAEFQTGMTDDAPTKILLSIPPSPGFPFYAPTMAWDDVAVMALAHEYTHALWHATVTPIQDTPTWIFEGVAESASAAFWPEALVAQRVQETRAQGIVPLNDPTGPSLDDPWGDLDPPTRQAAYTTSYLLVTYVQDTYGDDALIDLAQTYATTRGVGYDLHEAVFRDVLGVGYDEVLTGFDQWLRTTYGPITSGTVEE